MSPSRAPGGPVRERSMLALANPTAIVRQILRRANQSRAKIRTSRTFIETAGYESIEMACSFPLASIMSIPSFAPETEDRAAKFQCLRIPTLLIGNGYVDTG